MCEKTPGSFIEAKALKDLDLKLLRFRLSVSSLLVHTKS